MNPSPNKRDEYVFDNVMSFKAYLVREMVYFHDDFAPEFDALAEDVQDEMLAHAKLLEQFGPQLGRPRVDTLNVPVMRI